MEASTAPPSTPDPARRRRKLVMGLIVVGAIVGFLAVFALWAKRQLLETETWKETSTELLENEDIREQVGGFMVDTLFTQVDIQAQLEQSLPPRAQPAAGVIAGAARNVADDLANEALQRPKVQDAWATANENAHRRLLEVVQKGGEGDVTLDLSEIIDQLGGQIGADVSDKIPEGAGEIVILETDQLQAAQKGVDLLETLAWVLTVIALALFGLAIYLAEGWRRVALRNVGLAFIALGILTLALRGLAGNAVTESLASTASVEPAVAATWNIGTSLLAATGGGLLFYGIVILIGAWLASPKGLGHDALRTITPIVHRRSTAYLALLVILAILFWWSPTPGFERLPTSILLIALMVVGLEFLRKQAVQDFPDQTWEAGTARWQESSRSIFRRGDGDQ